MIDDSYNANPVSMRAAFDVLALAQGRKIAILGDMLELGEQAQREHADLAPALDRAGADLVFSAGPLMAHMHEALPLGRRGAHCKDALSLRSEFAGSLRAGDTVLVKGSLGSRMKVVVDAVVDHSTTHARQPAEG